MGTSSSGFADRVERGSQLSPTEVVASQIRSCTCCIFAGYNRKYESSELIGYDSWNSLHETILDLPLDVLRSILWLLPDRELARAQQVCRFWREAIRRDLRLWNRLGLYNVVWRSVIGYPVGRDLIDRAGRYEDALRDMIAESSGNSEQAAVFPAAKFVEQWGDLPVSILLAPLLSYDADSFLDRLPPEELFNALRMTKRPAQVAADVRQMLAEHLMSYSFDRRALEKVVRIMRGLLRSENQAADCIPTFRHRTMVLSNATGSESLPRDEAALGIIHAFLKSPQQFAFKVAKEHNESAEIRALLAPDLPPRRLHYRFTLTMPVKSKLRWSAGTRTMPHPLPASYIDPLPLVRAFQACLYIPVEVTLEDSLFTFPIEEDSPGVAATFESCGYDKWTTASLSLVYTMTDGKTSEVSVDVQLVGGGMRHAGLVGVCESEAVVHVPSLTFRLHYSQLQKLRGVFRWRATRSW